VKKLGGPGCYYVERRNTSGSWLRSSFQSRSTGGTTEWSPANEGVYDCVADSKYYQFRVWNGDHNGVTGIRFINPTRALNVPLCQGVEDCQSKPTYDYNITD
jgi:hypothetical protein